MGLLGAPGLRTRLDHTGRGERGGTWTPPHLPDCNLASFLLVTFAFDFFEGGCSSSEIGSPPPVEGTFLSRLAASGGGVAPAEVLAVYSGRARFFCDGREGEVGGNTGGCVFNARTRPFDGRWVGGAVDGAPFERSADAYVQERPRWLGGIEKQ